MAEITTYLIKSPEHYKKMFEVVIGEQPEMVPAKYPCIYLHRETKYNRNTYHSFLPVDDKVLAEYIELLKYENNE